MNEGMHHAWVLLDKKGFLERMGGELSAFGLGNLKLGCLIKNQAVFFDGMMSIDASNFSLENLELDNGVHADVHLSGDKFKESIIFVSKFNEKYIRQIAQQKSNELALLKNQIESDTCFDLRELFEVVSIEKLANNKFRILGPIPECFKYIYPDHNIPNPERKFPFLVNFLEDCDDVWKDNKKIRLNSGPWIEVNNLGVEYALEAIALLQNKRRIILIRKLDGDYDARHAILQRGREIELVKEKLQEQVHKLKLIEQKLIEAKIEAEVANKAKSDFLSSMGHELKTPLNAILGFSQLIAFDSKEPLSESQQDNIEQIISSGTHLLDIINQILELAQIESGKLRLKIDDIDPGHIIEDSLTLINVLAEKKNISLVYLNEQNLFIRADALKLKQVILNLLSNAIKYSAINDKIFIEESIVSGNRYKLKIIDQGSGIPYDYHDKIFFPFERLGREDTEIEGSGIGLAIVKSLVEEMNGTVGADSIEGKGSSFWVELPLANKGDDHNGDN